MIYLLRKKLKQSSLVTPEVTPKRFIDGFFFMYQVVIVEIQFPPPPPYNRTARYSLTASGFFMPKFLLNLPSLIFLVALIVLPNLINKYSTTKDRSL